MSGLAELRESLAAYFRGELPAETLEKRVSELIYDFAGDTRAFLAVLENSRQAGLPDKLYLGLTSLVEAAVGAGALKRVSGMAAPVSIGTRRRNAGPRLAAASPREDEPGAATTHAQPLTVPEAGDTSHSHHQDEEATRLGGRGGDTVPTDRQSGTDRRVSDATTLVGPSAKDVRGSPTAKQTPTLAAGPSRDEDAELTGWAPTRSPSDVEFGPFSAHKVPETGERAGRQRTHWESHTQWQGGSKGASRDGAIGPGYVLKDRFELLSALGEGGMGVVYKAIDRLKVEARDRNPFLAVKLLSGDFKSHPEAFIALQREASKAQRLAHPNIATVFDFDRDGDTIYMTMELLEGEPLNAFIKKLPDGGLPPDEAMDLIRQLATGLSYAHKNNLVHSDLKPGNCFITRDGILKLLDFGIARASKTKTDAEGETTVFDPAGLGALTPAYATIEMFEGQAPDPRDDIYALACIAYQLLAGKHPYNKVAAPRAQVKHLTPPACAKISKRQFKGLLRGLALTREARTPTVDQFLAEIQSTAKRTRQIVLASIAGLVLLLALGYQPVQSYFRNRHNAELATILSTGTEDEVLGTLETVDSLDNDSRRRVLEQGRDAVIDVFEKRVERAIDGSKGRYDYPTALKEIEHAKHFYRDSARLLRVEADIKGRRNRLLNELNNHFTRYLDDGRLLPIKGEADITDVLRIVAQADPDHPLLSDPRLAVRYAEEAEQAMRKGDLKTADAIVQASVRYAPEDARLRSLRFQIRRELHRQEEDVLVAQIQDRLRSRRDGLRRLPDFQGVREDLVTLAKLRPESKILDDLRQTLEAAFDEDIQAAIASGSWDSGEKLLLDFAKLLEVPYLTAQRQRLSAAENKAGYVDPGAQERAADIEVRQAALTAVLNRREFTDRWENSLLLQYKDLIAMLPAGDPWLEHTRGEIARLYMGNARDMRVANRFDEAVAYLDQGERIHPGFADFATEKRAIAAARAAFEEQKAENARLAQLEGLKQTLLTQAAANKIKAATETFALLRNTLSANDPFLVQQGPEAIGSAYLRLAQSQADGGRYEQALKLAEAGLAVAPNLGALQDVHRAYDDEVRVIRVKRAASRAVPLDAEQLRGDLARIKTVFPDRYAGVVAEMTRALEQRVGKLAESDPAAAKALLNAARSLFPNDRDLAAITLKEALQASPDAPHYQHATRDLTRDTPVARAPNGGRPCRPQLAGYGTHARATCYDMLAETQRGPIMVVIPAGNGVPRPFAMSKYEVSIEDFNRYCILSAACQPLAEPDPGLPVTGISYRQAQDYAQWLSERTGRHYRLPREGEWVYAASATGPPVKKDYNCRVRLGDQVLKGLALANVRSGNPNGWGLTNYVGNAQEWVITDNGLAARGGTFRDSLSQCDVSLSRPHNGEPDEVTGFRLVLEMG